MMEPLENVFLRGRRLCGPCSRLSAQLFLALQCAADSDEAPRADCTFARSPGDFAQ